MKSLYQTIFTCAPVGIEIYDQDGLLIDANAKCLEIFGISRPEHVRAFRLFEDPNVSAEHLASLQAGETVRYQAPFDFDLVRAKGLYPTAKSGRIDVDVTIAPVSDLPGRHAPGYLVVVQDVTSQNRVQEELRRSEEKHRILVEESPDPVFCLSREGRCEFANRALAEALGRPPGELVGLSLRDVFARHEADRRVAVLGEVFRTGESRVVEGHVPHPDGARYHVTTVNPVKDTAGRVVSTICSSKDITARKRAEDELEHQRWRLESIIQGTGVGTWEWNVQTGETTFNETWARMLGYTLAELEPVGIGTWEALAHPEDLRRSDEVLRRHFAGERPDYVCECRVRHKDGRWVWVLDRGRLITRTPAGDPLMMFGTHADITARKEAEEALERERQRLQKALDEVKTLRGIVPICASCKRIRDDKGYWNQVEVYVRAHTEAEFSHGVCPECMKRFYPEYSR